MRSPNEHKDETPTRPKTRGECKDGPRPCPWVSCRHHLQVDVVGAGSRARVILKTDPSEWTAETPTCSLDIADGGPRDLSHISRIYGRPRGEAERQHWARAMEKLRLDDDTQDLAEIMGIDPNGKPQPNQRNNKLEKYHREDVALIDLGSRVTAAYLRHVVEVPEIRDIPPESVDLLSLLRDIRKRNGKPRPERHHVPRRKMIEQLPKTRQKAKEEKPRPEPVEWI